jgi:uncharacterized protein YijF (DUF1287 family)
MAEPHSLVAALASLTAALALLVEGGAVRKGLGLEGESVHVLPAPRLADPAAVRADTASFRSAESPPELTPTVVQSNPPRTLPAEATRAIVERAREEVTAGVRYDASYRQLSTYPKGDVPADRGACTDVVIRALRAIGIDLQVLVHEDVVANPSSYGFDADSSVDHRRVPAMYTYFSNHALSLETDVRRHAATFLPGDVVFFKYKRCYSRFPCMPAHVGIVSDRIGPRGLPLVLQNGGPRATEADSLDHGTMVGHFRLNRLVASTGDAP